MDGLASAESPITLRPASASALAPTRETALRNAIVRGCDEGSCYLEGAEADARRVDLRAVRSPSLGCGVGEGPRGAKRAKIDWIFGSVNAKHASVSHAHCVRLT